MSFFDFSRRKMSQQQSATSFYKKPNHYLGVDAKLKKKKEGFDAEEN